MIPMLSLFVVLSCVNFDIVRSFLFPTEDSVISKLNEKLSKRNGVKEEESSWYWDPPQSQNQPSVRQYEQTIQELQIEVSTLKKGHHDIPPDIQEELSRLREENRNLTTNIEDLDNQHQLAMERLLTLKKELQKNFEILKQDHEDLKTSNEEFATERQVLLKKISERDQELEILKAERADYDTLQHKYINLETVHRLLKENVEKFQEENQELHEEVFKLQEQVTKYEHELELAVKHSELSNTVPRETYDELIKELNDLREYKKYPRHQLDEINIDDNAKTVIESLKRDIKELKFKVAQKDEDNEHPDHKVVKTEKIMQLYNKHVNFELPVDYIGEMPSSDDNIVIFKLESAFKTLNSFKKDIAALEHQLSEKNHNINHLQTQIDDLTTENDFLTTDIQHFESELNNMKKNNDFLISEIAVLKNSSKLEPIIETHEDNLAKLENELDNCTKINKNFESEINRIQKQLAEVQGEKSVLQESLAEMKQKYKVMLSELESFKTHTRAVEELEHKVSPDVSERLKKSIDESDDLKKKLHASNAKNEQLSIDLHIIENDKVLLIKEIDDLKNAFEKSISAHKEHEHLKTTLTCKLEDVKAKLEDVLKQKVEIENEKNNLQKMLVLLEEERKHSNVSIHDELQKALSEKANLTEKLEEVMKKNSSLNEMVEKLSKDVHVLKTAEEMLRAENITLKNTTQSQCEESSVMLLETRRSLEAKIIQNDLLSDEITMLKAENHKLIEKKLHLETELTATDAKITNLEQEFDKLFSELNEKDTIIDNLNATIAKNNVTLANLNQTVTDLNNSLEIKRQEAERLTKELHELTIKLSETSSNSDRSFEELKKLADDKEELQKQSIVLNEEILSRNAQISSLTLTIIEYKEIVETKDKQIKELNQSIVELTDKIKTAENSSAVMMNDEYVNLLHEKEKIEKEVIELKNYLTTKEREFSDVQKSCLEHQSVIEAATKEKTELINLINLKHNESIQYHNEIQRLNHVILEQTNEFKRIINEKDALIHNKTEVCSNCERLNGTLKEKDEIIRTLNLNSTEFDKAMSDLKHAGETIANLTQRCENLDNSLAIQLDAVKKLTAENAQLSEQEQTSMKELERLRHHLVEMEDNYTQELMTSEQKLNECQARLLQVEERAKQTSTVYTSNSIRANQEVETLRNQIRLLEKQREDVQAKLSAAEDSRNRSDTALTNLQIVLEQFQLDKERDIDAATEKIRNKMEDLRKQNGGLQQEIARLNAKLEEASAGLQAAARLGDQVETKTAQINDLKEQVRTLQISVAAAEERYYNAISNQQDKVDKNLVKNLVINYVMTAAQNATNKLQVLRILSTVLDFNQKECEQLGLVRSSTAPDSLAAEFVKFLQNESKPRAPLPNMMGLAQGSSRSTTPSVSRKNSTLGPQTTASIELGHNRTASSSSNNLLFQNIDNIETSSQISLESDSTKRTLDTGVTQPRDTEGSILKHVLRDI